MNQRNIKRLEKLGRNLIPPQPLTYAEQGLEKPRSCKQVMRGESNAPIGTAIFCAKCKSSKGTLYKVDEDRYEHEKC